MGWFVLLMLVGIGVSAYEATRPPACPQCPHCRQRDEEQRRRKDEAQHDYLHRLFGDDCPVCRRRP